VYSHWIRRNRRNVGIPLALVVLILAKFDARYLWLSIAMVASGEAIRIWAAGHLQKEKVMTTGGPYRLIRNPLYLGSFLIAAGFSVVAGSIWVWLIVFAYFLLCYIPVIRYEENILREKFPDEYPPYAQAVPALYPGTRLYPKSTTFFTWKQALKNKEYNAVLGILAGYVCLFVRSAFL